MARWEAIRPVNCISRAPGLTCPQLSSLPAFQPSIPLSFELTRFELLILHLTPYTLHPTPYTLHLTPYTLHPTPYTSHLSPYTVDPVPNTGRL